MNRSSTILSDVIQRAVEFTGECVTISDPRLPDAPLVYVNPAFYRVTGYSAEECIGKNCRFLQGPDTDPQAIETIRQALKTQQECVVELVNYRKDGTPFWNRLSIIPLFDDERMLTHFFGFQSDLTAERAAEKAKAQLAALRATMQTINDTERNFMSNIDYFRLQLEEHAEPEMSELYETSVENTLTVLTALSSAQVYHEREMLRGVVGIDLERIGQTTDGQDGSAKSH